MANIFRPYGRRPDGPLLFLHDLFWGIQPGKPPRHLPGRNPDAHLPLVSFKYQVTTRPIHPPRSRQALLSLGVGLFFAYDYSGSWPGGANIPLEILVGGLTILLVIEGARRATGALLPILGIPAFIFAYEGITQVLPPLFAHKGFDVQRIITFSFTSMDGIFGSVDNVLATYVLPFIILGAFLPKSGAARFFVDLPYALLGKYPAGTAQVAIASSAMIGMIGISPTANVVTAGASTISLMKKAGYRPEFAGAVEAGASTGDMFTPPVMGAAAFFMVEFTGIPYLEIIKIAAIPAALYYIGLASWSRLRRQSTTSKGCPVNIAPVLKDLQTGVVPFHTALRDRRPPVLRIQSPEVCILCVPDLHRGELVDPGSPHGAQDLLVGDGRFREKMPCPLPG